MVNTKIYRLPDVLKITGLSRSSIYLYVSRGDLPKPIRLGGEKSRAIGWRADDLSDWLEKQSNLPA
jgi:prophage regulatory protein